MVQMALKLCVFGLSNLNSADRAICTQGLSFWMRYLNLGELDPVLEHCEKDGYLEPEELKLLMGTGEFYKARHEKPLDAYQEFYDLKKPLITDENQDPQTPSEIVNPTDQAMNPENSKINQKSINSESAESELGKALFVPQ